MPAPKLVVWSTLIGLLAASVAADGAEARVLRDLDIPSPTLGQPIPCAVILPDGYDQDPDRRYPVLLLLHGTDGGHHDWLDAGGLADEMGAVPFIVVTPGAGNSWYVDNAAGEGAWETALLDDLLPAIDARFRTIPGRAGRAIAGLSMGGYGAVHLALRHPDQFAAVASLSGALFAPDDPLTDDDIADFHGAFGDPFDAERFAQDSVYTDLAALPPETRLPRFYLASGGSDQYDLDVAALRLYQTLKQRDVPATLVVRAGYDHGWQFWHDDLGEVLDFVGAALQEESGTVGQ
jgi:S-formylglutathione hydrolase FrmB